MKRFEQISDDFIIIIFLFCLIKIEYSVFKVEEKMTAEICSARAGLYKSLNLGIVFAECVHFLFSRIREYCSFFSFNLSLSLFVCVVCWRLNCSLSKQEIIY
jgi:hypothetical protein